MRRVLLNRKGPPHPRRGRPGARRSSDAEMPYLAPDATHPVERRSGSGTGVTTASTASTGAAAGTAPHAPPVLAGSTLAIVVHPGVSRPPGSPLLRSTSLTLHRAWRQEVAPRQLGPDGHCHREVGVGVDGPVGFQGVPIVGELERNLGLLQNCRINAGKGNRETFGGGWVSLGGCTDCAYGYPAHVVG